MKNLKVDQLSLIPVTQISNNKIRFIHNFFFEGESLISEDDKIEIKIMSPDENNTYEYNLIKGSIEDIKSIKFKLMQK